MNKLQQFLDNLMKGRYGADQLSVTLSVIGLCLIVGAPAFGEEVGTIIMLVGVIPLFLSVWRMFSKDIAKRQAENRKFLSIFKGGKNNAEKARRKAEKEAKKEKDRRLKEKLKTHEMFYCPGCKTACFVPKGKGKVRITCPKCGEKFIGKT